MGYTPMDFYDVGEFKQWIQEWPVNGQDYWEESQGAETRFGTRAELEALISQAHGHGLKVIADIVINHREAQQRNIQGEKIAWSTRSGVGSLCRAHANMNCSSASEQKRSIR